MTANVFPAYDAEPKGTRGRQHTLTDEKVALIVEAVKKGLSKRGIARYAGIGHVTFTRWIERGQTERARLEDGHPPTPLEAPFLALLSAYELAESELQGTLTRDWLAASANDWRASAEFLARRFPNEWAREAPHEAISVNLAELTDAELERIAAGDSVLESAATQRRSRTGTPAET